MPECHVTSMITVWTKYGETRLLGYMVMEKLIYNHKNLTLFAPPQTNTIVWLPLFLWYISFRKMNMPTNLVSIGQVVSGKEIKM
jgi:hypothetical protein